MEHMEQVEQNSQCSLCGKRYHITAEEYKEMYGDKAILSKKEANK